MWRNNETMVILMMVMDEALIEKLNRIVFDLYILKELKVSAKFEVMVLLKRIISALSNVETVKSIHQKSEKMVIKLMMMDDPLIER